MPNLVTKSRQMNMSWPEASCQTQHYNILVSLVNQNL